MSLDVSKDLIKKCHVSFSQLWDKSQIIDKIRILSIICLAILILYFLICTQDFVVGSSLAIEAKNYLTEVQKSSAAAFLVARSLNALISVVQSVEVGGSFIISGTVAMGELLDPINDMIERFSWAMLAVTVAIGIQNFLMDIGTSIDLTFLIVLMLALIQIRFISQIYRKFYMNKGRAKLDKLLYLVSRKKNHKYFIYMPCKILAIIAFIHLLIPLVSYGSSCMSNGYIENQRSEAIKIIEKSSDSLRYNITPKSVISDYEKWKEVIGQESDNIVKNTIKLMALFFIETMILPIFLAFTLVKIAALIIFPNNHKVDVRLLSKT